MADAANIHPIVSEECIASTFNITISGSDGCCSVSVEMNVWIIWESWGPSRQSEFGKGEANKASIQPVGVCFKNSGQISCNFPK